MTGLSTPDTESKHPMPRKMKIPPLTDIESEVSPTGNGAHVIVPKAWIGKKVKVIVLE